MAGREIDRAARHQRRFSLLIVNLDGVEGARPHLDPETLLDFRRLLSDDTKHHGRLAQLF